MTLCSLAGCVMSEVWAISSRTTAMPCRRRRPIKGSTRAGRRSISGAKTALDSHASFACLLNQKLDIVGGAPDRDAAQGLPNLMGYGRDDSVDVEWACKSCLPKPDEAVGIGHLDQSRLFPVTCRGAAFCSSYDRRVSDPRPSEKDHLNAPVDDDGATTEEFPPSKRRGISGSRQGAAGRQLS